MFSRAGDIKVKIMEVVADEPKFAQPPAFDICIRVEEDSTGESDWWRGEMSGNYGKGNFATQTQAEITTKTLRKLGWTGKDYSRIGDELVGKETFAHVKPSTDGKFFNISYLGSGGNAPQGIDAGTIAARMKALIGGAAAPAPVNGAPAPAQANAAPAADPFTVTEAADEADTNFNPFG